MFAVVFTFELQQVVNDELSKLELAVEPDVSAAKGAYRLLHLSRYRDEPSETVVGGAGVIVEASRQPTAVKFFFERILVVLKIPAALRLGDRHKKFGEERRKVGQRCAHHRLRRRRRGAGPHVEACAARARNGCFLGYEPVIELFGCFQRHRLRCTLTGLLDASYSAVGGRDDVGEPVRLIALD